MIGRRMLLVRSWIILGAVLLGLSLITVFSSSAQTPAEFGPETFVKDGRAPQRHVRTFGLASAASPCTLTVVNGDPDQPATRVGKMTLRLNNRPIIKLSELDPSIPSITKTVGLETRNRLALTMLGKTGALVTVTIQCGADNTPPTADAGADQTVRVGEAVVLDGSGSSDLDGDSLGFDWALSSVPQGSGATLSDPTAVQPSFDVDLPGTYAADLVVNDGQVDSAPDTVLVSTENSPPVADAGPDQTAPIGATVTLDGTGSSDADGDTLTFSWSLSQAPDGSLSELADPDASQPTLTLDLAGTYIPQLIVNDGTADSAPDTVTISTENTRPVADAGPDQAAVVGTLVTLDGLGSTDADLDPLTYAWSLIAQPDSSTATLDDADQPLATLLPDASGDYLAQLVVSDGTLESLPDTALISATGPPPPNQAPAITSSPVTSAVVDQPYAYDVIAVDPDVGDRLTYSLTTGPSGMTIDEDTGSIAWVPAEEGDADVTVQVTDVASLFDRQSFLISVAAAPPLNRAPDVDAGDDRTITLPVDTLGLNGTVTDDGLPNPPGIVTLTWSQTSGPGTVQIADPASAETDATFPAAGVYVLRLLAEDGELSASDTVSVTVQADPNGALPPDPKEVAPEIDPTVPTTVFDATEFLYSSPNPIQTGVAPGTIEERRVAVIRGKVLDRANNPLPGVAVRILDHPELGQTLSRTDGAFDLAVNGGGVLTLVYEKAGYLPAQRQVQTPWEDYAFAPNVSLVTLDPAVTAVDLTAIQGIQVARGTPITDGDGTRQATMLFPVGTTAEMVLPDGSTQPLTTLHLRATEYTIGPDGPQAMPAKLPPTSGYTYAVEITADEAIAAGATSVNLSRPVPYYVENFLGFPVGSPVPAGYYDQVKGQWIAAPNGRVIKVVGIAGGMADLDTDGDGRADVAGTLAVLGIDDAERAKLAELYRTDQSLWRVPLEHFTPHDYNWPYGPPLGAQSPSGDADGDGKPDAEVKPAKPKLKDDPCPRSGSKIGCETQALGEAVTLTGTPFSLHYQSDRTLGYRAGRRLNVNLTGSSLPPLVSEVELDVAVAGNRFEQLFTPAPNQQVAYTWDGRDAFGRAMSGKQKASVTISYIYDAVYYAARDDVERSFALASGEPTIITRQGLQFGLEQTSFIDLASGNPDGESVAGWSLSAHHRWDTSAGMLVRGDGTEMHADAFGPTITTVASGLAQPVDVAVAPDGSLLIAEWQCIVRRASTDGTITTAVGGERCDFFGDGGPATEAGLSQVWGIAVGDAGSYYIADTGSRRIRRVGPDGIITTVAGNGEWEFSGDGGPATAAGLYPTDVAVRADGSLYIADIDNHRVRRVAPDGIITTVAGGGSPADGIGDGGPATAASLYGPHSLAVASDGSLYIAENGGRRIRQVTSDGIIRTVAGGGSPADGIGDGGPATEASLMGPRGIAVGSDGSLYIADPDYYAVDSRLRRVGTDGIITTLVTGAGWPAVGDGGPASSASAHPYGVAVGADGSLYIADAGDGVHNLIRRIAPGANGLGLMVASSDGSEVYQFDFSGRHLRTLDALTKGIVYTFGYDAVGRLTSVTDGSGNVTRIERDGSGAPLAIVGPDGQRTELALDPSGYLASIANPAGETYRMQYTADGLLTRFEDPRGHASTMTYDDLGRLVRDADAASGSQGLARTVLEDPPGTEVTVTTAEGPATLYRVEDLPIGSQQRTVTASDGTTTVAVTGTDGTTTSTGADGTASMSVAGPDPRFGMSAPVTTSQTVTTPAGLTATVGAVRTANLTDPNDPLSLVDLTDAVTLNGRTSTSVYDAATRTTTSTSAAGRQSTTLIDALGRPERAESPGLAPVAFAYDARGRLETVTQGTGADARTATLAYDAAGNLASVIDALGRSAGFAYDPAGRVTRQTFPDSREVLFDYDAKGNLTALTPPGRPEHAFTYTSVDLTDAYIPPDVGAGTNDTLYSYNLDKQLTRALRPDGKTVDLAYNTAGRLATLTVPEGTFTYGYDAVTGNLSRITAPDGGTLDFAYDGSLPTGTDWAGAIAGSVGFAYDNDFRVSSVDVNGAEPVAYAYDPDSLLVQAGDLTLARDAQNGLLQGSTLGAVTDTWGYNAFGEPVSYAAVQGANALLSVAYSRDKLGRITEKTETVGDLTTTYAYGYDLAGRLVEVRKDGVVQTTWGYDANGNRTHVDGFEIAHYDDQDRLLDYAGATYAYTANGELQTKTEGAAVTHYDYDVLGNLRQVTLPNGTVIDYLTDGKNRRIGKKVNGTLVQGFLYQDQLKPVAELDGAGNVVSRFVYATHANVPDYMVKAGTTYRIITDHLGSPRLVINAATGAVVQRMDYDAWGNVLLDHNPGFQPFGFAGGLYDRNTKLVRFGARDYSAALGRWLAKDPLGFEAGGNNFFLYVYADPVNVIDAEGFFGEWITVFTQQFWEGFTHDINHGYTGAAFDLLSIIDPISITKAVKSPGLVFDLLGPCTSWDQRTKAAAELVLDYFGGKVRAGQRLVQRLRMGGSTTDLLRRRGFLDALDKGIKDWDRANKVFESVFKILEDPISRYSPIR